MIPAMASRVQAPAFLRECAEDHQAQTSQEAADDWEEAEFRLVDASVAACGPGDCWIDDAAEYEGGEESADEWT